MDKYIFQLEMKVRDYEVDCENIVNNANYLHYLEHTRHEFCQWAGLSFADMRQHGIDPVVTKVEIEYKTPLRSSDVFFSRLWVESKGPRFLFHQNIFKKNTGDLVVDAIVTVVCLENGRPTRGELLKLKFKKFLR